MEDEGLRRAVGVGAGCGHSGPTFPSEGKEQPIGMPERWPGDPPQGADRRAGATQAGESEEIVEENDAAVIGQLIRLHSLVLILQGKVGGGGRFGRSTFM
ncbi:hypothetical protein AAFF_G00183080 [Aldrovandia affinis]|uniref:Uncharacterized protein n=1 Tax=Aldrovandia affinis TaxID=143900 RepID=A0AAD7W6Z5_9TELE|nr:hypothetical protein AAFF_G00183080 [Aldrovandia affinis]